MGAGYAGSSLSPQELLSCLRRQTDWGQLARQPVHLSAEDGVRRNECLSQLLQLLIWCPRHVWMPTVTPFSWAKHFIFASSVFVLPLGQWLLLAVACGLAEMGITEAHLERGCHTVCVGGGEGLHYRFQEALKMDSKF